MTLSCFFRIFCHWRSKRRIAVTASAFAALRYWHPCLSFMAMCCNSHFLSCLLRSSTFESYAARILGSGFPGQPSHIRATAFSNPSHNLVRSRGLWLQNMFLLPPFLHLILTRNGCTKPLNLASSATLPVVGDVNLMDFPRNQLFFSDTENRKFKSSRFRPCSSAAFSMAFCKRDPKLDSSVPSNPKRSSCLMDDSIITNSTAVGKSESIEVATIPLKDILTRYLHCFWLALCRL